MMIMIMMMMVLMMYGDKDDDALPGKPNLRSKLCQVRNNDNDDTDHDRCSMMICVIACAYFQN